ncbi:MAG: hypothetical protein JWL69_4676, partial [Phycisphaerales bacterium]|nr:hypothetical protein [Phycisphaerales bacterium]
MAVTLRCPDCGKRAPASEGDAGQKMLCAACGTQFLVPGTPPVVSPVVPPKPAIPEPPGDEPGVAVISPERPGLGIAGWLVVGLIATALPVMGGIYAYNEMEQSARTHHRQAAAALKGDADGLLAKRQYPEAQVKYRELGEFISLHHPDDPYMRKLAADAQASQEKVSTAILSLAAARRRPATTAPAVALSLPVPTTRPATKVGPIASVTDSHPATVEPAPPIPEVPTTRPVALPAPGR